MKAGVWILVALTFAAGALAHHRSARTGNCFSRIGGRWNDCHCGRAFWRDAGLRCGTCTETVHAGIDFLKCLMPCFALDAGAVRDDSSR